MIQNNTPNMGFDAEQLFKGYDVFRANPEGNIYGSQFGMPLPSYVSQDPGYGRFDAVTSGLQAGDMATSYGMQPPPRQSGGNWLFSGSETVGAGNSGDDYVAPGREQSRWTWQADAAPQASPEDRTPRETQNPEFVPPALDIYDESPEGWDRYRNIARAEAEGLNRMPFTFAGSDAAYIPTDKFSAFEMFYPSNLQGFQNYFRNPLLESDTPPASLDSTGVSKPKEKDPFLTEDYMNPLFR